MYYVIFEGIPFEGKEKLAEQFYLSLLPHLEKKFKGNGFHEDVFRFAVHMKKGVNVAIFDDAEAVSRWRNEENHLRLQKKGSDNVYEGLRIRMGPEGTGKGGSGKAEARQYMTLFYRSNVEGTPQDDVTDLLDDSARSELKEEIADSAVFQGSDTVWITGWRSEDAAIRFEKAVTAKSLPDDRVVQVRIERDYTKSDRRDAPHEIPGMT